MVPVRRKHQTFQVHVFYNGQDLIPVSSVVGDFHIVNCHKRKNHDDKQFGLDPSVMSAQDSDKFKEIFFYKKMFLSQNA